MMPFLQVNQLHVRYDFSSNRDTLNAVNFELLEGESILLLGPSGCGKSTLTYCLNGLYPRELDGEMQGDVIINGKRTTDYRPGELAQHVGVVFQDPETQFCMLTVEDEVAFGLENIRIPKMKIAKKIDVALELVGLMPFKKATISSLSGGQKQKLALACILALEPKLLILDEPTANLDPMAAMELIETIRSIKVQTGCSLIIIEHQLDGWTELAERCVLLNNDGTIFYDGPLRGAINHKRPLLQKEGIWLPRVANYVLPYHNKTLPIPLTLSAFACQAEQYKPAYWDNNIMPKQTYKQALLVANQIAYSKRKKKIIQNVSINIYHGDFVAIIGSNGSGKTTLSRLLAGIEQPSEGSILLKNKQLASWQEKELRDNIGYVFQNPEHQFITDSVFEEVAYSLRLKELSDEVIKTKTMEMLDNCGLTNLKNHHPFHLSQGQKRRLSVATMLIDNQAMLILDEPTFGQDALSNRELMHLLSERHKTGTTIVMITHDMDLVYEHATRVIVMNQGEIAVNCEPEHLWAKSEKLLQQWQLTLPTPIQLKRCCERRGKNVSTPT
ncbi:ABC transporter ATP-binding protein [Virgibacillus sp. MG-45]|uniref:ABC transporter ATP-binding protein n=1 Tax=Virgibacillus sp. MG-45 TaxID=3102791 RepID=UPI002ED97B11